MPVSSPSYFPPSRGTDQIVGITAGQGQTGARVFLGGQSAGKFTSITDLVVIGHNALSSGTAAVPLSDTVFNGTVVIGQGAATALLGDSGSAPAVGGALVVLGGSALALSQRADSSVIIGHSAAASYLGAVIGQGITGCVLIGDNCMANMTGSAAFGGNVLIGSQIGPSGATNVVGFSNNTVIGSGSILNGMGIVSVAGNVLIGTGAGGSNFGAGICQQNIIIGQGAGAGLGGGSSNIIIGQSANVVTGGAKNLVIGQASGVTTGSNNVILGNQSQMIGSGTGNVMVGFNPAGYAGIVAAGNDQLLIGTVTGACVYGSFASGNVLLGNANGANQEFGGAGATNIMKLINGTKGGSNPNGGGYFYITAGALHYVGSAGTDTTLGAA